MNTRSVEPSDKQLLQASQSRSRRWVLWLLVLVFALPVISAKLILSQHWYQTGVTNHGQLITPSQFYADFQLPNQHPHFWQLAYVLPSPCQKLCQLQGQLLVQIQVALGKDQDRLALVLLMDDVLMKQLQQQKVTNLLNKGASWQTQEINAGFQAQFSAGQVLIVDPRGQLVMQYFLPEVGEGGDLSSEKEQVFRLNMQGLLADLRKLLKLSRVG